MLALSPALAVPPLLNYQGYLTDDLSVPLNGTVDLEFAIADSSTAGATLWVESHPGATVQDGIFHAVLGGTTPLDPALFQVDELWLETRVAGVPLTPRRPFLSVPYAIRATIADQALSGGDGDDDWAISGNDIHHLLGNVGIGTSTPTERLHVADGLFARLQLERTGGSTVKTDASLSSGSVGTTTSHPFRLLTGNSVRMHIDSDGEIGIGSTAPDGKLDVRASGGQDLLNLYDGAANVMSVVTGGKVGIGTGAPDHTLHVAGNTSRAIYGGQSGASGTLIGVFGETNSITGTGVRGQANHASGQTFGVHGQATGTGGTGVLGENNSGSGATYGLYGRANSATGYGVYATNNNASGHAAYFDGNATTAGSHQVTDGLHSLDLAATTVAANQDLGITAAEDLTIGAAMDCNLTGRDIALDSDLGTNVSAGGSLSLSSNAGTSITSAASTTITGSFVRLNGNVGLGQNPGFQLHLSNNSAAKPTSNTWTIASDRRLKKNIEPLHRSLDRLMRLRGVTYQWRTPETQGNMIGTYPGFIAQEVEPVFPDWVEEGANGYKHLTVIGFEALAVEALRDLRAEKDAEIDLLREQLRALAARLDALERAAMADAGEMPAGASW